MIATATISAQPTCTDGMAENSSASKPPLQEYTDWPYCTAVSTMPVIGSSRGGAHHGERAGELPQRVETEQQRGLPGHPAPQCPGPRVPARPGSQASRPDRHRREDQDAGCRQGVLPRQHQMRHDRAPESSTDHQETSTMIIRNREVPSAWSRGNQTCANWVSACCCG